MGIWSDKTYNSSNQKPTSRCLHQFFQKFTTRVDFDPTSYPWYWSPFHDLEWAIITNFLPVLLDKPAINGNIQDLIALSVKFSGMGIPNPTTTSAQNFVQSQVSCSMLILSVQGKSPFLLADHKKSCCSIRNELISRWKEENGDLQLSKLLKSLPNDENWKNYSRCIIAHGDNTGIWLSTIPNSTNGNILGAQEFIDTLRRTYALVLKNFPEFCDGCGAKFSLSHAQSLKFVGPIRGRHDAVKYKLFTLLAMATCESAVRAKHLISPVSLTSLQSNCNNEKWN